MKRMCSNCKHWIPLIDNGQCNIGMKLYCEHDDKCGRHEKITYMDKILRKYSRNK